MSRNTSIFGLFAVVATAACGSSGTAEMEAPPAPPAEEMAEESAAGPSFSALQVNRGSQQFESTCTACHSSGEFNSGSFQTRWGRRSVGDLYERILTTMPDDAPGLLTPEQTANIVAYMLQLNGLEASSSALEPDQEALDAISLSVIQN